MSLRTLPLPLLLLTVALTPVDLAQGHSSTALTGATQVLTARQQAASYAAVSGGSWRRRRSASKAQDQVSEDTLLQVGSYLRCQSERIQPYPDLCQAWASFHRWCDAAIRRYAAGCHLHGPDLDDCVQEVWSDLLQSLRTFRLDPSRGSFNSWLYRIVHSKAADLKRQRARRPSIALSAGLADTLHHPGADPLANQERQEDQAAVRQALSRLQRQASQRSFQVLHLRQIEGWSVRRVAEALGLTAQQVWAREHRIKRKLQELLRSHGVVRLPRGSLMRTQADVA